VNERAAKLGDKVNFDPYSNKRGQVHFCL